MLGIAHLLDRRPRQLSGGQRQRVAMGRAIVRRPQVFLFDEPLSNLDAKLRGQVRTEIKKLHQTIGTTIIYVTHDQVEAMTLADRIVILKGGEIEQVGTPDEVYDQPGSMFVGGFVGAPAMNFARARRRRRRRGRASTTATGCRSATASRRRQRRRPARSSSASGPSISSPATPLAPRLTCQVQVVEPLGADTLVSLSLGRRGDDGARAAGRAAAARQRRSRSASTRAACTCSTPRPSATPALSADHRSGGEPMRPTTLVAAAAGTLLFAAAPALGPDRAQRLRLEPAPARRDAQGLRPVRGREPRLKVKIETGGNTSELQAQYLNTVLSAKDSVARRLHPRHHPPGPVRGRGLDRAARRRGRATRRRCSRATCRPTPRPTRSTASSWPFPPSPTPCSSTTARTCSKSTGSPCPRPGPSWPRRRRRCRRRESNPQPAGRELPGQGDRGRGLHLPPALLEPGQGAHRRRRQAHPRQGGGGRARSRLWLDLVDDGRRQEEHRRGRDRRHAEGVPGRQRRVRGLLVLRLGPLPGAGIRGARQGRRRPLPAVEGGEQASCIGGWQWGVSAFSEHPDEAAKLVRFMSSPETSELLAVDAALLPIFPALYEDPRYSPPRPGSRTRCRWFRPPARGR